LGRSSADRRARDLVPVYPQGGEFRALIPNHSIPKVPRGCRGWGVGDAYPNQPKIQPCRARRAGWGVSSARRLGRRQALANAPPRGRRGSGDVHGVSGRSPSKPVSSWRRSAGTTSGQSSGDPAILGRGGAMIGQSASWAEEMPCPIAVRKPRPMAASMGKQVAGRSDWLSWFRALPHSSRNSQDLWIGVSRDLLITS
jgi:hypothetical protein